MSWDVDKLEDLAETRLGKRLHRAGNKGDYYPYLGNDNIQWGELKLDIITEIRLTPGELERYRVRNGDLLVCEGGDPGRCAIWNRDEEMYCQMALHRVRPDENKLSALWLKYYLMSLKLTGALDQYVTARTTIKHIPQPALRAMPVRHPDIETQRRIASILMAYDNLIENNRKQIALLEEAAQRLYKEWFIDLHFPGHEDVEIVDGVPQGWRRSKLGEYSPFRRGKTITAKQTRPGMIPVVAGGLGPAYYHSDFNVKGPVVTVSGSGANAGFTRLYLEDIWASDCSYVGMEDSEHIYFIYLTVKMLGRDFGHLQRGSAQPHVYPSHINDLDMIVPSQEVTRRFNDRVSEIYERARCEEQQILAAREARDRLLPKLMSGEIEV